MSFIKDITILIGKELRYLLISVAIIMPFWYFGIYIFGKTFFTNSPVQIPIVLSFCLSFFNIIIHAIGVLMKNSYRAKKDIKREVAIVSTTLALITIVTSIGVFSEFGHNITLIEFINSAFIASLCWPLYWAFALIIKKLRKK